MGGNNLIKMSELRSYLEQVGFSNVNTILASGNIIFDSPEVDVSLVRNQVQTLIQEKFRLAIPVIIITAERLTSLFTSFNAGERAISPEIVSYATFLGDATVPGQDVIFSTVSLSCAQHTTDLMLTLEREYGKNITTRNMKTLQKISALI